jgi:hypothetical protein
VVVSFIGGGNQSAETRPNDFDSAIASLMLSRFLFVKFHKFVSEPF